MAVTEQDLKEAKENLHKRIDLNQEKHEKLKERFDKMDGALPGIEKSLDNIDKATDDIIAKNSMQDAEIAGLKATKKLLVRLTCGIIAAIIGLALGIMKVLIASSIG